MKNIKRTDIMNSGNFVSKAPNQKKHSQTSKVENGGDLRANSTGGNQAKR